MNYAVEYTYLTYGLHKRTKSVHMSELSSIQKLIQQFKDKNPHVKLLSILVKVDNA
jgi:hypothetical protein